MRVFFTIVVPLLLPTLLYMVYLFFVRPRFVGPQGQTQESPIPWLWLAAIGGVLAVATFFAVAELDGAPPGSRYEPARVIDGEIEPGHFE
jgi:hypothetical protein